MCGCVSVCLCVGVRVLVAGWVCVSGCCLCCCSFASGYGVGGRGGNGGGCLWVQARTIRNHGRIACDGEVGGTWVAVIEFIFPASVITISAKGSFFFTPGRSVRRSVAHCMTISGHATGRSFGSGGGGGAGGSVLLMVSSTFAAVGLITANGGAGGAAGVAGEHVGMCSAGGAGSMGRIQVCMICRCFVFTSLFCGTPNV